MRFLPHSLLVFAICCVAARAESDEAPNSDLEVALKHDQLREIAQRNPQAEVYRLTIKRSFGPVLVFELEQNSLSVRKVRLIEEQDKGEFTTAFRLVRKSSIPLESEEFRNFQVLLQASSFWELPAAEWMEPGLDGSSWKLEAVKAGKYHSVIRQSPFTKGPETPLSDDVKKLNPERALFEGRLVAAFVYLWGLAGDANEQLY